MSIFSDIDNPIQSLVYITHTQKKLLAKSGITTLGNLLANVPIDYENRKNQISIYQSQFEKKVLVQGEVITHNYVMLKHKGRLLIITIADDSGRAELHCYGREFLKNTLSIGENIYIWGNFSKQYNKIISSSFEVITNTNTRTYRLGLVPRYKVPSGFSQITYSKMIKKILSHNYFEELHPYTKNNTQNNSETTFIDRDLAIRTIHMPHSLEELSVAQQRLAFDEILLFQLFLTISTNTSKIVPHKLRTPQKNHANYATQLSSQLPFELTNGQLSAIHSLEQKLWEKTPMTTLLQGDVGSGKTLVALFCALSVIELKEQVAFAVPSESLAYQHFLYIRKLFTPLSLQCALLTSSIKKSERKIILERLKNNEIQIIIGTHALYSNDVEFNKLGLIIIDEQHRFGVMQRAALIDKGISEKQYPDVLLMSATPIPRSLALTVYGNINIVSLKESPAIQQPIQTRLINYTRRKEVYKKIKIHLEKNEQAFFIFPQIDFSNEEENKNSTTPPNSINEIFNETYLKEKKINPVLSIEELFPEISKYLSPFNCKMLHSKLPDDEKNFLMDAFHRGEIDVLVATTIIEVGIDVPNASTIAIFNAERFGLATLHQLRGRVGRGTLPSEAILLFGTPLSDIAKQRLKIIYEESDGFLIAEKDMKLRGPGDIHQLGNRQSGAILFQFADVFHNIENNILELTLDISKQIIQKDPLLQYHTHTKLNQILCSKNLST